MRKLLSQRSIDVEAMDDRNAMPIHFAAMKNKASAVEVLALYNHSLVNIREADSYAPLHYAAINGADSVMQILLDESQPWNSDPKTKVNISMRALKSLDTAAHLAAGFGYVKCLEILYAAETPSFFHFRNRDGYLPIHSAVVEQKIDAVRFLATEYREYLYTDLEGDLPSHTAADIGDEEILFYLLSMDAELVTLRNDEGLTVLHIAIIDNHVAIVRRLLNKYFQASNGNMNYSSGLELLMNDDEKASGTPLHLAIRHNHLEILYMLLGMSVRINLDIYDERMRTPLHIAVNEENFAFVAILTVAGADTEKLDMLNRTPLERAIEDNEKYQISKYLVQMTQDPLPHAIVYNHPKAVRFFCTKVQPRSWDQRGDRSGETPLQISIQLQNNEALNSLLILGARPEKRFKDGNTCLHVAVQLGNTQMTQALVDQMLSHRSLITLKNKRCETALDIAIKQNKTELIDILSVYS